MINKSNNLIDKQNSLVIDVTYKCNSHCLYCQWGDDDNPNKLHEPLEHILIPHSTIKTLNANRIVLSGGEPLLRKDLEEIIAYYQKSNVDSIILITNGLLLSPKRLKKLIQAGLTGITFSIDTLSKNILNSIRGYSITDTKLIFKHIENVLANKKNNNIEIGINTVLSSTNIRGINILNLINFCNSKDIDWIKFTPIFNDGYVDKKAPWLILNNRNSKQIMNLGKKIIKKCKITTNNLNFWKNLSDILGGKKLLGKSCGLDTRQAIAIRGQIKFCFWINKPIYGKTDKTLSVQKVKAIQIEFKKAKEYCKTGMYCFCLQDLNHRWDVI